MYAIVRTFSDGSTYDFNVGSDEIWSEIGKFVSIYSAGASIIVSDHKMIAVDDDSSINTFSWKRLPPYNS